ncbi:MAG: DUF4426 domain-containing protein [Steroidobacteraceae bacterium]
MPHASADGTHAADIVILGSGQAATAPGRAGRPRRPGFLKVRGSRLAAILSLALLSACGSGEHAIPPARPFTDPGFAAAGDHELHYALVMSRDLPSGIAGSYGIVPRRNLALLTITLARRSAPGGTRLAPARLEAMSVGLTGERAQLPLMRHDEAGGPTWLATVKVRHRVPVTIEIRARATAASPEIVARLTREFHFE